MALARPPEQAPRFLRAGNFRQRSGAFGDTAPRWKKSRPYFVGAYRPPIHTTDVIRVHAARCEQPVAVAVDRDPLIIRREFWEFIDHWDHMTKTGAICSAGPFVRYRDRRGPCRGCDLYWNTLERDGNGKLVARADKRTKYAFSVLDYNGTYHFVSEQDRLGRPRLDRATRAPFGAWQKCTGRMCEGCRMSVETKTGHALHWPMSWTHFQQMREFATAIGQTCASCAAEDAIQSEAWICSNPACGELVVDMSAPIEPKELARLTESTYPCPACGQEEFLEEVIACSACKHARRTTLFEVDLRIKRIPTANTADVLMVNWSAPRPIPDGFRHLAEPVDLASIFAPTPIDLQERLYRWKPPAVAPARPERAG